jgi:hypothetical protein
VGGVGGVGGDSMDETKRSCVKNSHVSLHNHAEALMLLRW